MPTFRIKEAASLLGISTDTLYRWIDAGRITAADDASGLLAVDGVELAALAQELAEPADHTQDKMVVAHSVRNRFSGLVTRVVRDTVMAQVEIQAGPHRFVSLLSREATDELSLEPVCRAKRCVLGCELDLCGWVRGHRVGCLRSVCVS